LGVLRHPTVNDKIIVAVIINFSLLFIILLSVNHPAVSCLSQTDTTPSQEENLGAFVFDI
jgi:hypothetical protein